ncbi:hypothetical protein C8R44DRAFT_744647 [Mycena epipterygia]|nr:hypothetical protein C8R44DRAFT_744647 [Mycena epipterygia]
MSKSSLLLSPRVIQPSLPYSSSRLLPLATLPVPYNQGNITEVNKVQLGNKTFAYHTEILRSHQLLNAMQYENIDSLEIYTLHLAPLARHVLVSDNNGTIHYEHEVVLPPYDLYKAAAKMMCGVDPDFSGVGHHITHHDPTSADVWVSAYIESPDHLLFHAHDIQNHGHLHYRSTLKAPSAWSGVAIVIEKVGESSGWTILELRLLATSHTIYLRVLNKHVAMDRTCHGRGAKWIRITGGGEHTMT